MIRRALITSLLALCLGWGTRPSLAEPALDAGVWLPAYQAYLARDYATAHEGFARVLRHPDLDDADRLDLLWYDTVCLRALHRPEEAIPHLEALARLAPDSRYLVDGRPILLAHYLAKDQTAQADTVWQAGVKQWKGTPYLAPLVAARTVHIARATPDQLERVLDALPLLPVTKETFTQAYFQPLLAAGLGTATPRLHLLMKGRLAAQPDAWALAHAAYEELLTETFVEETFESFTQALTAGDRENAAVWLGNLNLMVPEHPRAVEARRRYREALLTPQEGAP